MALNPLGRFRAGGSPLFLLPLFSCRFISKLGVVCFPSRPKVSLLVKKNCSPRGLSPLVGGVFCCVLLFGPPKTGFGFGFCLGWCGAWVVVVLVIAVVSCFTTVFALAAFWFDGV